jgi:hypothetical protein
MMLIRETKTLWVLALYLLVVFTGARSAIMAGSIYTAYVFFSQIRSRRASNLKLTVVAGALAAVVVCAFGGLFSHIGLILSSNFTPLLETSVTSDSFGSARVYLNRIAVEEIIGFNLWDWIIGRTYSSLGDLYEVVVGFRSWPHNDYVMTLYCYGIIGILIYGYYLFVYPWLKHYSFDRWHLAAIQSTMLILGATAGLTNYPACYLMLFALGGVFNENRSLGSMLQQKGHNPKLDRAVQWPIRRS